MSALTAEQAASRERTLLLALLLSMWAPLATGIAVLLSHSTTQLADFIRRTVELVALFVSWWAFRSLQRNLSLTADDRARRETLASRSVAAAMICSGIAMATIAASRVADFRPGGNVIVGVVIAILGLITNGWFWRRYAAMTREHFSPIIGAQRQLYRAKTFVDCCVLTALMAVAIAPAHPATRAIDLLGSVAVAAYLMWSGVRTIRLRADG